MSDATHAWIVGPLTDREADFMERACRDIFRCQVTRRTGDSVYLILEGVACTEAGLKGFMRGIQWAAGLDMAPDRC